jgi:glycolate oxidase FAD binding subunit
MIPQNERDLSDLIKDAPGPLRIMGGGTRSYAHVAGDTVDMRAMTGITLYEPGAMTIVAKAGTPVSEINAALAAENQRLAFEPMDHRALLGTSGEPTIGGVVAANISGPRRISVGACRDFLLGVRFVDGAGAVVKNGGRVMKNVTGYDLVKLMAGAYGTLGVLTEVSLKVLPNVAQTGCVMLHGLNDTQAVVALSTALGSPFEVTGAAHLPRRGRDSSITMIRIEGFAESVAYRADRLRDLLAPFGDVTLQIGDTDGSKESWDSVRDVSAFADQPGDIWRISVKPSDAAELVTMLDAKEVQYDWGGGLIWALTNGGDIRARLGNFKGHATRIRGTGAALVFHPEPAPIAIISAGLRAKFDPRNILNRGLMT